MRTRSTTSPRAWAATLLTGLLAFGGLSVGATPASAAGPALSTTAAECVVTDATITWGFKEAFRSYVSGAIAHGEWTVADGATYDIPNFGWSDGQGGYDPESGEGLVAFTGAVTFTGHGGVLNTTISNPQLRFDGADTATLLLDVSGDTRDGVVVNQPGVEFATIDLGAAETETDAGEHTILAAPAVLTADGSAAFGTYEPGTELDPITIAYSTDADCPALVTASADDVEQPAGTEQSTDAGAGPGWLLWAGIAAALAVIAAVVWMSVARRRGQG